MCGRRFCSDNEVHRQNTWCNKSRARHTSYPRELLDDGDIVINASFMAARASGGGISFLGNPPPSQRAIGEDCSYQTGQFIILRGKHDFLLQVNDFAGNQTDMRISITSY